MDSRFHLKVEFSIYGETYKWDCSLNWSADGDERIDPRITEWFLDSYNASYEKWHLEQLQRTAASRIKEAATREISELKRLRAKYPDVE